MMAQNCAKHVEGMQDGRKPLLLDASALSEREVWYKKTYFKNHGDLRIKSSFHIPVVSFEELNTQLASRSVTMHNVSNMVSVLLQRCFLLLA